MNIENALLLAYKTGLKGKALEPCLFPCKFNHSDLNKLLCSYVNGLEDFVFTESLNQLEIPNKYKGLL